MKLSPLIITAFLSLPLESMLGWEIVTFFSIQEKIGNLPPPFNTTP
jgi:hypothetical protein